MSDLYVSRTRGCVAWPSENGLTLRLAGQSLDIGLSSTAAVIWSLCDDASHLTDLHRRLVELFPKQSEEVAAELPRALKMLEQSELIEIRDRIAAPADLRSFPILRVALAAFWPQVAESENPLAWLLAERYSVVLTDPSDADLMVFSTFDSVPATDPDRTLRLLYAPLGLPEPTPTPRRDYDLALIGRGEPSARHFLLPAWSLYLDWSERRRQAAAHPDGAELLTYDPEQVCGRIVAALESLESLETYSKDQPPSTPTPTVSTPFHGKASDQEPRLTIGMATHGDFDGVYFTAQAIRTYHPEMTEQSEILILDNDPKHPAAAALQQLGKMIPGLRYETFDEYGSTAIRDLIFRWARAPFVVCLDSHVLVEPGALHRLLQHFEADPDTPDLLQGPLLYDDHKTISTHFRPVWSNGMYGQWGTDPRAADPQAPPFEILMQGLGLFACARHHWPGLNPRFRGFGGEEGYLHEKIRRQGGRTLCLPFLRWLHRFARPSGTPFANTWDDRVRNYLIGHQELGLDPAPVIEHFRELLGEGTEARIRTAVEGEMRDPLFRFDAVYQLGTAEARLAARRLGDVPANEVELALAHRQAIERAWRYGYSSVLVAHRLPPAEPWLGEALDSIWSDSWDVVAFAREDGGAARKLEGAGYSRRAFQTLLREIPETAEATAAWLESGGTLLERWSRRPGGHVLPMHRARSSS